MKRLLPLILILIATFSLVQAAQIEDKPERDAMVFGVISDTHIAPDKQTEIKRLNQALQFYQERNVRLSAVVGDLTDRGSAQEYHTYQEITRQYDIPLLEVMGNHENNSADLFYEATGDQPNQHKIIDGYHFITVSPGTMPFNLTTQRGLMQGGVDYLYARKWLKSQLDQAVIDDPTKPVFVFIHAPVYDTLYVSKEWFGSGLHDLFDDYRQAVVFSGHIHSPNNHPLSIYQDKGYTAVNTASLSYLGVELGKIDGYEPAGYREFSQGLLVTVDNSQVTIKTYDFIAQQFLPNVWSFIILGDRPYSASQRRLLSEAPYFQASADLTIEQIDRSSALLTFDAAVTAAHSVKGDIVQSYRVQVRDIATGLTVANYKTFSRFYQYPMPAQQTVKIKNLLPGRSYHVRIYPINAFEKEGGSYLAIDLTPQSLITDETPADDGATIRFGVISDTHIAPGKQPQIERLNRALNYFDDKNMDAVLIAGDLTDQGSAAEYAEFKRIVDNRQAPQLIAMGNHEGDSAALFTETTGQLPNQHTVINGYHFITVSPGYGIFDESDNSASRHGGGNYTYIRAWLQEQLKIAEQDDPTKPIFVMFHHPIFNTFYVSTEWFGTGLEGIFNQYPQVVSFAGHIHSPNNHPLSIWQDGGFTAVNTVSLSYFELESGMVYGSVPPGADKCAQGLEVEVKGSEVTIKNYDFISQSYIAQTWTFDVNKPLPYTTTARKLRSKAPYFDDDSQFTITKTTSGAISLTFDQAKIDPDTIEGDIVHHYKYKLYQRDQLIPFSTFKTFSEFYFLPMPEQLTTQLPDVIENGDYRLDIIPYNAYGKRGKPLQLEFNVKQ